MKFRKGQTVYVIGANDKIFKAVISHTHPKDADFPYELDLPVRNRFYPADSVFATRAEADAFLQEMHAAKISDALTSGKNLHLVSEIEANPDGSFTDASGNKITRFYELSPKEKKELDALCAKVDSFCNVHNIPYLMTVIMANKKAKGGAVLQARCTSMFPGPRTPELLLDLWDIQCEALGMDPEE